VTEENFADRVGVADVGLDARAVLFNGCGVCAARDVAKEFILVDTE
jgi:hypothetical protein